MKTKIFVVKLCCFLVLALGSPGRAPADVIAYSGSYGPQTFSLGTQVGGSVSSGSASTLVWGPVGLNLNFVFPRFDTSLGDLTNVGIDFVGAVGGSADILFANDELPPLNQAGINVNLTTEVVFTDLTNSVSTSDTVFLNRSTTATSSATPFNFSLGSDSLVGALVLVPTANVSAYEGTGTFEMTMGISFSAEATTSNGAFAVTPFPTLLIDSARIQYEFTPVPEPSSIGIVTCFTIGILIRCRR